MAGEPSFGAAFDEWDGILEDHGRMMCNSPLVTSKLRKFLEELRAEIASLRNDKERR